MSDRVKNSGNFGLKSLVTTYKLLSLGLALLLIAIIFVQFDPKQDLGHILKSVTTYALFFKELAFAIIIAVIISIAIEMVARAEFNEAIDKRMEDFQKHVFLHTYGRNISPALIGEIDIAIFQANFMRRNHRLVYRMKVIKTSELDPDDKDLPDISVVICDVDMSYEVENISASILDYPIKMEVEKPPFEKLKRFTKIRSISINVGEPADEEINFDNLAGDTGSLMQFEKNIAGIEPGAKIFVKGSWRMIKSLDDSEVWRSILPSDGMTLCVNLPKEAKVFGAHSLHRLPINTVRDGSDDYCEWRIPQAVLPYQGIIFWWRCSMPPTIAESERIVESARIAEAARKAVTDGPSQI